MSPARRAVGRATACASEEQPRLIFVAFIFIGLVQLRLKLHLIKTIRDNKEVRYSHLYKCDVTLNNVLVGVWQLPCIVYFTSSLTLVLFSFFVVHIFLKKQNKFWIFIRQNQSWYSSSSAVALQHLVGLGLLQESIPFFSIPCPGFPAVSYTHLDVYKRQLLVYS